MESHRVHGALAAIGFIAWKSVVKSSQISAKIVLRPCRSRPQSTVVNSEEKPNGKPFRARGIEYHRFEQGESFLRQAVRLEIGRCPHGRYGLHHDRRREWNGRRNDDQPDASSRIVLAGVRAS